MKKQLIIIAMIAAPLLITAQGLNIRSVTPGIVCPGDSLHVVLEITEGNHLDIRLQGPGLNQIWQYSLYEWRALPTQVEGADTTYLMALAISPNMGIGTGSLRTVGGNTHTIVFYCIPTGLPDVVPAEPEAEPRYFDLYGNQVSLRPGEILVEQRGNTRRKILVQ